MFIEIIGFNSTKLHLYSYVVDTDREITVATGEHMMLHVDTKLRRVTPMETYMHDSIANAFDGLRPLLQPKGLGAIFANIESPLT
ncbi:bifunctional 3-hydroxyacyl-CoA dehydrogenase/thioesterase [compost metagenome]